MLLATAPAPLPAPRPFPVRALDSTTGALLLVGAIWALIGAIAGTALLSTAGAPWNDMILDRRGVVAQGQALSAIARNTRVNRRRVFELTYSFTDAGGVARTTSTVTTTATWSPRRGRTRRSRSTTTRASRSARAFTASARRWSAFPACCRSG